MPLNIGTAPISMSVTVRDYNNEEATTEVFFPQAVGVDNLAAEVAAVEAVIAGLTDGWIVGGGITLPLIQTDQQSGPPPITSNVQRKGRFLFRNAAGSYNTYQVPSVDRDLIVPGTDEIDLTALAVQAYVGLMLNGIPALTAPPVGGGGQDLLTLIRAYEYTSQGSRRRR